MTKILGNGNEILIVDDDSIDTALAKRCFLRSDHSNPVVTIPSAESLLEYMASVQTGEKSMPAVVLLDINLSGMSGFEALAKIRANPYFKDLPVFVMLTTSDHQQDKVKAKKLGAKAFFVKPTRIDEFVGLFNSLVNYL